MKKLMFAAVAALAMVGAANAAQSYGIEAQGFVRPYWLDEYPSSDHNSWYSGYVMKQEDAQKAMGTTETVTYETMAEWLGKNFAANKQSVIDNAELITCAQYKPGYTQYKFLGSSSEGAGSGLKTAIGVFFYDDGANVAYNVMANGASATFDIDDEYYSSSGWQAATTGGVPEPTSGLLLLLGVAGLALKRQ